MNYSIKNLFHFIFYAIAFKSKADLYSQIKVFSNNILKYYPFNILSSNNFFSIDCIFDSDIPIASSISPMTSTSFLGLNTSGQIEVNTSDFSNRIEAITINNISSEKNLKQIINNNNINNEKYLLTILLPPREEGSYENEFEPTSEDDFYFIATSCDQNWEQVILRAACKLMGLGDEFELSGADFVQPEKSSGRMIDYFHPNLLYSDTPNSSIPATDTKWSHLDNKIGFDFPIRRAQGHPTQADWSIPEHNFMPNNIELWEGGGGYRTHIYRSAHDCLMRRQIGNKNLPVREAVVPLCPVCAAYVKQQILEWGRENRVRSLEFRGFIQQL